VLECRRLAEHLASFPPATTVAVASVAGALPLGPTGLRDQQAAPVVKPNPNCSASMASSKGGTEFSRGL